MMFSKDRKRTDGIHFPIIMNLLYDGPNYRLRIVHLNLSCSLLFSQTCGINSLYITMSSLHGTYLFIYWLINLFIYYICCAVLPFSQIAT